MHSGEKMWAMTNFLYLHDAKIKTTLLALLPPVQQGRVLRIGWRN